MEAEATALPTTRTNALMTSSLDFVLRQVSHLHCDGALPHCITISLGLDSLAGRRYGVQKYLGIHSIVLAGG